MLETINISEDLLIPKIQIDCEIKSHEITLGLIKELEILDPHGQGNPTPLFMTRHLVLTDINKVGANGAHLKLKLTDGEAGINTIGFRMGDLAYDLALNKKYDIAYHLEANEWNGFESAQLSLVDIKESN